jgi:hypothetical protein
LDSQSALACDTFLQVEAIAEHCPIEKQTSSRLMLLLLDSLNMTSEGSSSISLTLSSFSQKSHTAFTLTEAFHGDFLRCTDEAQRRNVIVGEFGQYGSSDRILDYLPGFRSTTRYDNTITLTLGYIFVYTLFFLFFNFGSRSLYRSSLFRLNSYALPFLTFLTYS